MVLLKAPGELTRALNEPLPCVYNVSQMYFSPVQRPWLEARETLNLRHEKGRDRMKYPFQSCVTQLALHKSF